MRATFVKYLETAAKTDKNIFILTGDLGKFFDGFRDKFPERFINCGIAEENMVGVAAGLALSGKNVYCYSIIPFLTMRALEKIRIDLCLHDLNVKLLGAGGGLAYGLEGATHHAVEDIAIMRALPNMAVAAPGDFLEAKALAKESVSFKGPLYIRFGPDKAPNVHRQIRNFKIGKGIVLKRGKDVALIVSGGILYQAKLTADNLGKKGLKVTLVSMPTIKPIDKKLIKELSDHKIIFTIEDHSMIGGLGSAVSDELMDIRFKGLFKKIALPDEFSKYTGKVDYLYKCYGLDSESITKLILKTVKTYAK